MNDEGKVVTAKLPDALAQAEKALIAALSN